MVQPNTPNPLVSVAIPTYNNAGLIGETINSVRAQTYRNLEIIVVDDGSTDETAKVVKQLIDQDSRIIYKKIENSLSPTARNTGFLLAKGEFLACVDSDDLWPVDRIEKQLKVLEHKPDAIVLGAVQRFTFSEQGERQEGSISYLPEQKRDYIDALLNMNNNQMVNMNTFMAKRTIMWKDGLWDPSVITGHDWEVWIRLARKYEFIHLPDVLQYYRKHSGSTTVKNKCYKALKYQLMVVDRHSPAGILNIWKRLNYRGLRYQGYIGDFIYEGEYWSALKLWCRAALFSNTAFSRAGLAKLLELAAQGARSFLARSAPRDV